MLPLDTRTCGQCGESFQCKRHKSTRFCSVQCSTKHTARTVHRDRFKGAGNPRYNGGLCKRKDGRWLITCRDGSTVLYYRAVMESHLGRALDGSEIVHHVNGDPSDDRIENLELTNRTDHINHHRADLKRVA